MPPRPCASPNRIKQPKRFPEEDTRHGGPKRRQRRRAEDRRRQRARRNVTTSGLSDSVAFVLALALTVQECGVLFVVVVRTEQVRCSSMLLSGNVSFNSSPKKLTSRRSVQRKFLFITMCLTFAAPVGHYRREVEKDKNTSCRHLRHRLLVFN